MKNPERDYAPALSAAFVLRALCLLVILPYTLLASAASISGTVPEPDQQADKMRLIASVNNENLTSGERINALDSLSRMQDPALLDIFKDAAFRSDDVTVAVNALGMLWSFIYTDRWNEACDTLADVLRKHPVEVYRDSALQALKITEKAFQLGIPFDRHDVLEALIAAIDKNSYLKDAGNFFSAVWLLAQIACKTDHHAVAALEYVRDHFTEEYALENVQNVTYAYQSFKNSITKSYIDGVTGRAEPPLIADIPTDSNTQLSITIAAYMLDSAVTDSLGFAALSWLANHADGKDTAEKKRLVYLYDRIEHKRPDKALEISAALRSVLEKYGVGIIRRQHTAMVDAHNRWYLLYIPHGLLIGGLTKGDAVRVMDIAGRVFFSSEASMGTMHVRVPSYYGKSTGIVTVNGRHITADKSR